MDILRNGKFSISFIYIESSIWLPWHLFCRVFLSKEATLNWVFTSTLSFNESLEFPAKVSSKTLKNTSTSDITLHNLLTQGPSLSCSLLFLLSSSCYSGLNVASGIIFQYQWGMLLDLPRCCRRGCILICVSHTNWIFTVKTVQTHKQLLTSSR